LSLVNTNWTIKPDPKKTYQAQVRYHGEFLPCTVKTGNKDKATVEFKQPQLVSPGQSIVIYDKDTTLGGGVVQ
jgi:tRNA-specific 2-thiouridylase